MIIKPLNGPIGGSKAGGGLATPAAEAVDVVFTNVSASSVTLGYPVAITTTAASLDGQNGVLPAAANLFSFYGIALKNVPANGIGLARAFGYCASVAIYAHGTSVTTGAGVAIGPAAGSLGVSSTGNVFTFGPVIAMEAIGAAVNSTGGYAKGFVRAL